MGESAGSQQLSGVRTKTRFKIYDSRFTKGRAKHEASFDGLRTGFEIRNGTELSAVGDQRVGTKTRFKIYDSRFTKGLVTQGLGAFAL